jgi:hypothetical protein
LTFKDAVDLLVEDGVNREVLDDIKCVISVIYPFERLLTVS